MIKGSYVKVTGSSPVCASIIDKLTYRHMRIIRQGKDSSPVKRMTCRKCKCIFEYDSSDIELEEGDGCYGQYHYVVCPNSSCEERHKVNEYG